MTSNPPRNTAIIWGTITIFCVAMIFVPDLVGLDGFDGGYAVSFVSFFGALVGTVVVAVYSWQARLLDRLLSGEGLLAHWVFTPEMWTKYSKKEYVEEKAEKKGLFLIISGFALFFGVLFWALDAEAGFIVFLVMLGLIGIVGAAWQLSAWSNYRQNKSSGVSEAYIGREAVYMKRKLYSYRILNTRLSKVGFETKNGLDLLVFEISGWTMAGPQTYLVRVPVPDGQEETAKMIVQELKP